MDRVIVYPGSIPLDTDLLNTNRNVMVALGALVGATLGTGTVVDGLSVGPTLPASMAITIGPGSITQLAALDAGAYGSLAADTSDSIMKQGVNVTPAAFTLAAPLVSGQAITYLVQATFQESDGNPTVLPYYNAANPAQPFLGSGNSGAAQATVRTQRVQLQLKAGAAAVVGTQLPPPVDTGWVGLATIAVSYGQSQVVAGNITALSTTPVVPFKLPALRPGFAANAVFTGSGTFVVPPAVSTVRVVVLGGGGAGGTHAVLPGGGGGAGGLATRIVTGLVPGQAVPVTVGAGGVAPLLSSPASGGGGGTSSFGAYVSATGGNGGYGGTALISTAGGAGGYGAGGDLNVGGSSGTDGILIASRGGDGGGPGNGRGTTGPNTGVSATGFGGGGGGGGCSQPNTTGSGTQGGNGAGGYVIVEY